VLNGNKKGSEQRGLLQRARRNGFWALVCPRPQKPCLSHSLLGAKNSIERPYGTVSTGGLLVKQAQSVNYLVNFTIHNSVQCMPILIGAMVGQTVLREIVSPDFF